MGLVKRFQLQKANNMFMCTNDDIKSYPSYPYVSMHPSIEGNTVI